MKSKLFYFFLLSIILNPCEAQIKSIPGDYVTNEISDYAIMYFGASHRKKWTVDEIAPLVTHTFADGHTEWFFPAFLYTEFAHNGARLAHGYAKRDGVKSDWEWYSNVFFQPDRGFKQLDLCIEQKKKLLGDPKFKHRVMIALPSPIEGQTNWGKIGNKTMDFNKKKDRIQAVKWFIDLIVENFKNARYANLQLEGFTWRDESFSRCKEILPEISKYVHKKGIRLYWGPYNNAPGRFQWKELGFDIAYLQPNYYFKLKYADEHVDKVCNDAKEHGMGLVFEINDKFMTERETYMPRAYKYLEAFERNGVLPDKAIAYYHDNATFLKMSQSSDPRDREFMEKIATIVCSRNKNNGDLQRGTNPYNSSLKSTRKLNPEDWHF